MSDLPPVDHLVYAVPSLEQAIDSLERILGVRAVASGRHLDEGTWNALIALGPDRYLEIIAPDPDQPAPVGPRWFSLDSITAPGLVAWAARGTHLEQRAEAAERVGLRLGRVKGGSRQQPDGQALSWVFTDPHTLLGDGLVPFLIDWGTGPHPAQRATPGVTLVSLRAEHPAPEEIRAMLRAVDIDMGVGVGPRAALVATLETPRGQVELR